MADRATMTDLRNGIEDVYRDVVREQGNGEAPNALVLSRLRSMKAAELHELNSQLVDIALTKLLNEVSNRKGAKAISAGGLDLFGEYRGIPQHVTIARTRKKDTAKLTFVEIDLWLKAHSEKVMPKRHEELRRLVEDCRPFKEADDDTLQVAMERRRLSLRHGAAEKVPGLDLAQ